MLRYYAERDFAILYAWHNPALALECALMALECALALERPDLIYAADDLVAALRL